MAQAGDGHGGILGSRRRIRNLLLHTTETAFTGHVWLLIGQGALFGGGFWGLAELWGSSTRRRR